MDFYGAGSIIRIVVSIRGADAHSSLAGIGAGGRGGGIAKDHEVVAIGGGGKIGAAVAIEISIDHGLRRSNRIVKINRFAPACALGREEGKNGMASFKIRGERDDDPTQSRLLSHRMDGRGLASGEGIKRIGEENSCAEVSAAKIGKRDHAGAIIKSLQKRHEQVASAVAIEIDRVGGLQGGVAGEEGDRRAESAIRFAVKDHNVVCHPSGVGKDGGNVLNVVAVVVAGREAGDPREGRSKNILLLREGALSIILEDHNLVKFCRDNKAGKLAAGKSDQAQRISATKADAGDRGKIGMVESKGPVAVAEEHGDGRAVGAGQGGYVDVPIAVKIGSNDAVHNNACDDEGERAATGKRAISMVQKNRKSVADGLGSEQVSLAVMIQVGDEDI